MAMWIEKRKHEQRGNKRPYTVEWIVLVRCYRIENLCIFICDTQLKLLLWALCRKDERWLSFFKFTCINFLLCPLLTLFLIPKVSLGLFAFFLYLSGFWLSCIRNDFVLFLKFFPAFFIRLFLFIQRNTQIQTLLSCWSVMVTESRKYIVQKLHCGL